MQNNFFGSKLNTFLLFFLIILVGILIWVMSVKDSKKNIEPKITKSQAEILAAPLFEKCWNKESAGSKVVSYTTVLIDENNTLKPGEIFWRIGGNILMKDSSTVIQNTIFGDVPEVLVNAITGEIESKHFAELGQVPEGCI